MRHQVFLCLNSLSLLLAVVFSVAAEVPGLVAFEQSRLIISGVDGREHSFTVELALSAPQRSRGLMFRDELAKNAGMLFLWEDEAPRLMWLKNTKVPLDMIFFDNDGLIFRIEHWEHISCKGDMMRSGAMSPSEQTIPSGGGARGVLELYGGITHRLGITTGDRIVHPLLPSGGLSRQ